MRRVLIIGLGLIGGSYAKALSQTGLYRVDAFDRNEKVLLQAEQDGVIARGISKPEQIEDVYDIVVLSLYPEGSVAFMFQYANRVRSAIVCDVAGLQGVFVNRLADFLKQEKIAYVSLHPMAGRERSGYEMAVATLFVDRSCLYTNITASSTNLKQIKQMHAEIGFAVMQQVEPEAHDRLIAYTSQLPHVIAAAFMNGWQSRPIKGFTGGSFEDLTRVADMNTDLWQSLFLENKEALLIEIEVFEKQIGAFKAALEQTNKETLYTLMHDSSTAKQAVRNQLLKEGTSDG